jgi:hypothetical protein
LSRLGEGLFFKFFSRPQSQPSTLCYLPFFCLKPFHGSDHSLPVRLSARAVALPGRTGLEWGLKP